MKLPQRMTIDSQNKTVVGVLLTVLMTVIASTSAATCKYLTQFIPVELLTFFQYSICLLLLLPLISSTDKLVVEKGMRLNMFVRGVSGLGCFYAYYAALRDIPLVEATLLRNSAPLFVPLMAFLWIGTEIKIHDAVSVVLGFFGVYLVFSPQAVQPEMGHFYAILSAIGLSLSMVSTRVLSANSHPSTILFYYYFISILGILPSTVLKWQEVPINLWPYIFYVGLSIHIVMYLYTKALSLAKATVIAPITYLSVVHTGVIGWVVWGYKPAVMSLLGMALVILAGIIVSYFSAKEESTSAR